MSVEFYCDRFYPDDSLFGLKGTIVLDTGLRGFCIEFWIQGDDRVGHSDNYHVTFKLRLNGVNYTVQFQLYYRFCKQSISKSIIEEDDDFDIQGNILRYIANHRDLFDDDDLYNCCRVLARDMMCEC